MYTVETYSKIVSCSKILTFHFFIINLLTYFIVEMEMIETYKYTKYLPKFKIIIDLGKVAKICVQYLKKCDVVRVTKYESK